MTDNQTIEGAPAPRSRRVGRPPANEKVAETMAAAARVQVREPVRDEGLRDEVPRTRTRKRRGGEQDKFAIPKEMIPAGSTYEWKRYTTYGQSDPSYDVSLRENGWLPVDTSKHPEFMPPGHKGAIIRDGMILMERPTYLTDEARAEDNQAARDLIRAKETQLGQTPPGTLPRDHPRAEAHRKVSRSYAPIDVPED